MQASEIRWSLDRENATYKMIRNGEQIGSVTRNEHKEFVLAGVGTFRFMRQVKDYLMSEIAARSRSRPCCAA